MKKKFKTFKILFALCLSVFLFYNCKRDEVTESVDIVKIDLENALPLAENIRGINVRLLSDSGFNDFPGKISKIEWLRDTLVVMDMFKAPGVYLYDTKGKQIGSYTKRGNGPEEFINIFDISVNDEQISILESDPDGHIINLDHDLNFLNKKKTESQANHFILTDNGSVWIEKGNVANGSDDKLVYYKKGKRNEVLKIPEEIQDVTFTSYNVFSRLNNDTVLYLPPVENRIYVCSDGQAKVLCEFDFNGLWPDFSKIEKSDVFTMFHQIHDGGLVHNPLSIFNDGETILFTFFQNDDLYLYIFNMKDLSSKGFYKLDKASLENVGSILGIKNGQLIFGEAGKLVYVTI